MAQAPTATEASAPSMSPSRSSPAATAMKAAPPKKRALTFGAEMMVCHSQCSAKAQPSQNRMKTSPPSQRVDRAAAIITTLEAALGARSLERRAWGVLGALPPSPGPVMSPFSPPRA